MSDPGHVGLAELPAVHLDDVEILAALDRRVDHKYLIPEHSVKDLVAALDRSTRVLEIDGSRCLRYQTVYFDTSDLDLHLASARGRPQRFKVRTRTYVDSGTSFLEVKVRDRTGLTIKHRTPWEGDPGDILTAAGRAFLAGFEPVLPIIEALEPVLTVTYRRSTLLEPTASRVTIDTAVEASSPSGGFVEVDEFALVETKTLVPPTAVDRHLWSRHQRPTAFSKYCTLLAAIDTRVPANKWSRTLKRLSAPPADTPERPQPIGSVASAPRH